MTLGVWYQSEQSPPTLYGTGFMIDDYKLIFIKNYDNDNRTHIIDYSKQAGRFNWNIMPWFKAEGVSRSLIIHMFKYGIKLR